MIMSPHDVKPPAGKDEPHRKPQETAPKCPRCDSSNTKFCYYNNYSLAQPRHFCKTCRRYWTKGGALRNVPIGGGCRKAKKTTKPAPTSSSSDLVGGGSFKFFQGVSPAMDFQLNFPPKITSPNLSNPNCYDTLNFHMMNTSTLATSIESLSSINQDLHWKLQRQRLGMLFAGPGDDHTTNNINTTTQAQAQAQHQDYNNNYAFQTHVQNQKPQPILFQNLDVSKRPAEMSCGNINIGDCGGDGNNGNNMSQLSTEWFFDNSYAAVNPTSGGSGGFDDQDTNNWNGIHQGFY